MKYSCSEQKMFENQLLKNVDIKDNNLNCVRIIHHYTTRYQALMDLNSY